MSYYQLQLTYTKGNLSFDSHLRSDSLKRIIDFFDRAEKDGYVTNWTLKEYSKATFIQEDLIAETGSNHPVNAGAIFYDLYDDETVFYKI